MHTNAELHPEIERDLFRKLFTELHIESYEDHILQSRSFLEEHIATLLDKIPGKLSESQKRRLIDNVIDRVKGFGPLQPLLYRPDITEIMVNGAKSIFVERNGKIEHTDVEFIDDADVLHTINRIVGAIGRRIDESSPMVDARLPDGSRVNAVIPPLSVHGPVLTIRKFAKDPFTLAKLVEKNTVTQEMADLLQQLVREKNNILIVGGTGSGKTSTLNALSREIPNDERLISIEDLAELQLSHPNVVSLEARPSNSENKGEVTIRTLLMNALRMRPNRIIIGEIRGTEALDLLQAMNTGHQGSLTTIHANAALEGLIRLETLAVSANAQLPLSAVREQVWRAIDVVVYQQRMPDGARRMTQISRVGKEHAGDGQSYVLEDLYTHR